MKASENHVQNPWNQDNADPSIGDSGKHFQDLPGYPKGANPTQWSRNEDEQCVYPLVVEGNKPPLRCQKQDEEEDAVLGEQNSEKCRPKRQVLEKPGSIG